jgi:phosphate starvation-inducible PhoH-like protein
LKKNRELTRMPAKTRYNNEAFNYDEPANILKFDNKSKKRVNIIPRNLSQELYLEALQDDSKKIVFSIGPAGTGKSYLGTLRAIKALREGEINKIVIVRPAVGAEGENHGFLPGDLNEKLSPWVRPIIDVFEEFYQPYQIDKMIKDGVIELASLMYLRGRTFNDSILIIDEMQNGLPSQTKLVLTRLGRNCRAFVNGDLEQTDHTRENGLADFIKRLKLTTSDMISMIEFSYSDIVRSEITSEVLRIYKD